MITVSEKCPLCNKIASIEINETLIKEQKIFPVTIVGNSIEMEPYPHRHLFFIDKHLQGRGVSFALLNVPPIKGYKFIYSKKEGFRKVHMIFVDTKEKIADCRLLYTFSCKEIFLRIITKYIDVRTSTEKIPTKDIITLTLSSGEITTKKTKKKHIQMKIYMSLEKLLGMILLEDVKIKDSQIFTILKNYNKNVKNEGLEFIVNAIENEKAIPAAALKIIFENPRIKEIRFPKLEKFKDILNEDLEKIVNKLKNINIAGKDVVSLSKSINTDIGDLANLIALLKHYDLVLFK